MYMFASYGHIENPKYNHRFFDDFSGNLAWASLFKVLNQVLM